MANVLRYGLHPVNALTARARRYEIASGYNTALYRGDAVTLLTAGTIERFAAGGQLPVGIVKEFEYTYQGKRVRDHYLPATTTYSPTARGSVNASYVWVFDDPHLEFWVPYGPTATTTALSYAGIGANL